MIIVGIATFIAALPSIILIIAQFYSQLGALDGDPLGVPGYFTPLLFLVFTITFLLIIYALRAKASTLPSSTSTATSLKITRQCASQEQAC
jgi:hypothetical protein